jgi:hypothetical protein
MKDKYIEFLKGFAEQLAKYEASPEKLELDRLKRE